MLSRRILAGIAAATALVAGLTGCGGGSAKSGGNDGELKVWMVTQEDSQKAAWDAIVADFEAANPGLKITTEQRAIDAHKEALRQVSGTKAGPDVYWYWEGQGLGGSLVKARMSKDLSSYYTQYKWEERFSSAALAGVSQYGGYHGVPWTVQGEALFYNKDLFAQAGVSAAPTSYEELVAAADKLLAAGITPIQFGGTVNWHVMRLLDSLLETKCGAQTMDEIMAKKVNWGQTPCVTEAFTELKIWADKYFNKGFVSMSNDDSSQLFFQGKAAMALEGTWFDSNIKDNGLDPAKVGIVPFPTGTNRLYGFGEAFYINENSPKADDAAKFLDFITNTESQTKAVGAWAATSVNKKVQPAGGNPLDALWPPIFESAQGMYVNSDQALSLEETTEYWRIQNAVAVGQMDPAEAGKAMQTFIESHQ